MTNQITVPGAAASRVSVESELLVVVEDVCSEMESEMETSLFGEIASSTCMGSAGGAASLIVASTSSREPEAEEARPVAADDEAERASRNSTSTSPSVVIGAERSRSI